MAYSNIKRDGKLFSLTTADELNQMTNDCDVLIESYKHVDLDYRIRNVQYGSFWYKIGRVVFVSGIVHNGERIKYAPLKTCYFLCNGSGANGVVVSVSTKGVISWDTGEADTVNVFGAYVV